jgi:hypothetical protein
MRLPGRPRCPDAATPSSPRRLNVSVDLDGLGCYHSIHGIEEPADPTAIYTVALPRFLALFAEHGVRATFFVITSDLEHPSVVRALHRALEEGHEVASHTHRHPYNLRWWSDRGIARELIAAEQALSSTLGIRPVGFRTPGYNVDTRIVRILAERGYLYDSSVFPCPPYYAAKGAVLSAMALMGRESGSSMTDPAALFAPLEPYRPSRWNFARRGDRKHSLPVWEFPIGVTPLTRLPVIGTSVGALPPWGARALFAAFSAGRRTLQFELHGIDLMDRTDEGISDALVARQPDLRRAWTQKAAAYSAFLDAARPTWQALTLETIARQLDEEHGGIVTGATRPSSEPGRFPHHEVPS